MDLSVAPTEPGTAVAKVLPRYHSAVGVRAAKMATPTSDRETEDLHAVPEPAILAMPVQVIALRSLNPFKLLARLLH